MSFCSNCGGQLSDSAKFCPHCGASFGDALHESDLEGSVTSYSTGQVWGAYFTSPFNRFRDAMAFARLPAVTAIGVLLSGCAAFLLMMYASQPSRSNRFYDYEDRMKFGDMMKMVMMVAIIVVIIAVFIMLIKIMAQEKVNFGSNLLSAAFGMTSIMLMYVVLILIALLANDSRYGFNPFGILNNSFGRGGAFRITMSISIIVLFLYKAINAIVQGLRGPEVKDGAAYYLAPFILCFGCFLGGKIAIEILK